MMPGKRDNQVMPDNHATMSLAKEIEYADWEGFSDSDFLPEWVRQLAKEMLPLAGFRHDALTPTEFLTQIIDSQNGHMEQICRGIHDAIGAVDNDDGWPTNKTNSVIYCTPLAFHRDTRWAAELSSMVWEWAVGSKNYNSIVKISKRHWQRHIFSEVASTLQRKSK